ncbi:OCIA domain-containing protein 1 [Odontomachus brunneus]|uniref:OCIA domain-containing protein 1 n=1 Tax=Odontomachus brunneus TaxID=486640 RepID=UPI0013F1DAC2|nr:OCIA domain-containing protein 1 [Odontomachus brunneus]
MTMGTQQPDYGRPDFGRQGQKNKLQLTVEETNAWQDCMKSSSILAPSIVCAAISYTTFRFTRFRAQAKYAAAFGAVMGLTLSRATASQRCLFKVASMPNSTLKDRIMEARYGNKHMSERQIFQSPDAAFETQGSEQPPTEMVFDDYPPMNSYDTYNSLNDSSDIPISEDMDLTTGPINLQKNTTYEELRHNNREEYYKKTRQYYVPQTAERYPTTEASQQQQQQQQQTPASIPIQGKTKYGDVWG